MNGDQLEFSTVLDALRRELAGLHESAGRDPRLPLTLGDVEIEMTVVVTRELAGKAGVKFWVVEAGGSAAKTDAATQRVKLTLHPPQDYRISKPGPPT